MNYSKKNFVFYVSIIFCPWLQGSVENNINFVYTAALLNGGIAAVQNAPYGFNTTGGMPVKSPLSGYQLPDSLTLSTCNADGYSLFYIPFKNKESPFIEMGFKYSEIRDMPSQYMFTHSKGHLFKASRNGFFILKFLLTDFAYTGIKKNLL
jgi:hypothetical protein